MSGSDGDAVRRALPEDMEVVMKQVVRVELRPDKWEERIAVVSDRRVYIISVAKGGGKSKKPGHSKIEQSFHLLHVTHIASSEPSKLTLTVKGRPLTMEMMTQTAVDQLIALMLIEIEGHLPANAGSIRLQVEPSERENSLLESAERELKVTQQNIGPCGGFVKSYRFLCDYFELPIREDVAWQIDAVYRGSNKKTLELRDFAHLASNDMLPLIAAVCFNDFFTSLDCSQVKLTQECQERLTFVLRKNTALRSLSLDSTGLKGDSTFQKIMSSAAGNTELRLEALDLSNNSLEDKGVNACAQWLEQVKHPLVSLNLSTTKCSARGAAAIGRALAENKALLTSLKSLNMSDNSIGSDGYTEIGRFVSKSTLETLDLQNTSVLVDVALGSVADGKAAFTMSRLNLSDNKVSHPKKGHRLEFPKSVIKMFHATTALRYLNLSNSKLPIDLLRGVFQGLQDNMQLKDVELVISGNEFGSSGLGSALTDNCAALKKISTLDISNNDLENDVIPVCAALRSAQSVRNLSLGANFGKSGKVHPQTLQAVGSLIADAHAGLEMLSLADSRIRGGIGVILRALLSEDLGLQSLDIRGNLMGDGGAHVLAKVLQVNTSLHTVLWDRNGTTQVGFRHIAFALESNFSLLTMPLPLVDAAAVLNPETEALMQRMQELVTRNHSPESQPAKKKARRQNIITTSVAQEERLDFLVSKTQDKVNLLHSHRRHADVKEAMEKHEKLMDQCNEASELMGNFDLKEVELDNILEALKKSLENTEFQPLSDLLKTYPEEFVKFAQARCGDSVDDETVEHLEEVASHHAVLESDVILKIIHSQASHGFASAMNDVVYSVAHKVWVGALNHMVKVVQKWDEELYALVLSCKGRPTTPATASPEKAVSFSAATEEPAEAPEALSLAARQRKLRRSRPPTISLDEEFDALAHGGVDTNNQTMSPSRLAIFPEFREKMAVLLAEAEDEGTETEGPSLTSLANQRSSPEKDRDTTASPAKAVLPGFLRKKDKPAAKEKEKPAPKEKEKPAAKEKEKPAAKEREKNKKAESSKSRLASQSSLPAKEDFPDMAPSAKALTHVTKGRAAPPPRKKRGRPQRQAQDAADGPSAQSSHDLFATSAPEPDDEESNTAASADKHDEEADAEVAAVTALMPPAKPTSSASPLGGSSPRASPGLTASVLGELKKKHTPGAEDSPKPTPRSGSDAGAKTSGSSLSPEVIRKEGSSGKSSADTSPTPKPRASPRPAVKPKKPIPRPGEKSKEPEPTPDSTEAKSTTDVKSDSSDDKPSHDDAKDSVADAGEIKDSTVEEVSKPDEKSKDSDSESPQTAASAVTSDESVEKETVEETGEKDVTDDDTKEDSETVSSPEKESAASEADGGDSKSEGVGDAAEAADSEEVKGNENDATEESKPKEEKEDGEDLTTESSILV